MISRSRGADRSEDQRASCSAVILAGGGSLRLGSDKALLEIEGQTLLERVVSVAQLVSDDVLVIGRRKAAAGARCYPDARPHEGPLAGLMTGIAKVRHEIVFALACDLPYLNATLLKELGAVLGQHQGAVPIVGDRAQPLHATYSARIEPKIRRLLETGERSLHALLEGLDVRWMPEVEVRRIDPELISFMNVNDQGDWRDVQARQRVVGSNS